MPLDPWGCHWDCKIAHSEQSLKQSTNLALEASENNLIHYLQRGDGGGGGSSPVRTLKIKITVLLKN